MGYRNATYSLVSRSDEAVVRRLGNSYRDRRTAGFDLPQFPPGSLTLPLDGQLQEISLYGAQFCSWAMKEYRTEV